MRCGMDIPCHWIRMCESAAHDACSVHLRTILKWADAHCVRVEVFTRLTRRSFSHMLDWRHAQGKRVKWYWQIDEFDMLVLDESGSDKHWFVVRLFICHIYFMKLNKHWAICGLDRFWKSVFFIEFLRARKRFIVRMKEYLTSEKIFETNHDWWMSA